MTGRQIPHSCEDRMKLDRFGLYEKAMPDSFTVQGKLELAGRIGYDWMEISIDESEAKQKRLFDIGLQKEIGKAVETTGVPIESICLSAHRKYPLGEPDENNLIILRAAVDLAVRLGIRMIQLAGYDTYYNPSTEETRNLFFENLKRSVDYAASRGVALGFETMETDFMNTVGKAMVYVNRVGSPYLGVYPDIGNISNATPDPVADILSGRGHIIAAHLKETKPGIFRDMEFGNGAVDFKHCVEALHQIGVHRFTTEFWYDGKTEPEEYVRRNFAYVQKVFAGA